MKLIPTLILIFLFTACMPSFSFGYYDKYSHSCRGVYEYAASESITMNKFDLEPLTSSKNDGSGEVEDSYSGDEDYKDGSSYDDKDNRSNESGDEYTADEISGDEGLLSDEVEMLGGGGRFAKYHGKGCRTSHGAKGHQGHDYHLYHHLSRHECEQKCLHTAFHHCYGYEYEYEYEYGQHNGKCEVYG